MKLMNQSNQRTNTVTEFEYQGRKVQIREVMGLSELRLGYAIYVDGLAWATGWKSKAAARKNAIKLIDSVIAKSRIALSANGKDNQQNETKTRYNRAGLPGFFDPVGGSHTH